MHQKDSGNHLTQNKDKNDLSVSFIKMVVLGVVVSTATLFSYSLYILDQVHTLVSPGLNNFYFNGIAVAGVLQPPYHSFHRVFKLPVKILNIQVVDY